MATEIRPILDREQLGGVPGGRRSLTKAVVLEATARAFDARRLRSEVFDSRLDEPSRLILLELRLAEPAGRQVSTTEARIAAGVSATTGLRCVDALLLEGLVERILDRNDRRRANFRLTDRTRTAIDQYWTTLAALPRDPDVPDFGVIETADAPMPRASFVPQL